MFNALTAPPNTATPPDTYSPPPTYTFNRKIEALNFPSVATPFSELFTAFVTLLNAHNKKPKSHLGLGSPNQGMSTLLLA